MHVFYHKNKFTLSGRAKDVLRFVRAMRCETDVTLRDELADRTFSRKVHSFVIRETGNPESQDHPEPL